MKGKQQPYLSIPKIFERPLCEKIPLARSQSAAHPTIRFETQVRLLSI
jgi:hypothetical protein